MKHEPLIKIDEFESVQKDHKPKKISYAFNNGYFEYKSDGI